MKTGRFVTRRRLVGALLLVIAVAVLAGALRVASYARIGAAYKAKFVCSGLFVSGRPLDAVVADLEIDDLESLRHTRVYVDAANRTVTASTLGLVRRRAAYRDGAGCALYADAVPAAERTAERTRERPQGSDLPVDSTDPAMADVVERAFDEPDPERLRRTRAIVVVRNGRIIAERYGQGIDAGTPLLGWSMTKSVLHALVGILVGHGRMDVDAPAPVRDWQEPGDPRAAISLDHLLRMSSGLAFDESYGGPDSDILRMLFESRDAAGFAAAKDLVAEPGTRWEYSSGTSNIVAGMVRTVLADDSAYLAFPRTELFDRIGMTSALLETDAAGTWIGSSYMYATARDWARFGLLYLQDGEWNGERILPEGWVSHATSPAPADPTGDFGAHFWLRIPESYCASGTPLPAGAFHAAGHEGQVVTVVPSHDAVIVRLGKARYGGAWDQCAFVRDILAALDTRPVG